MSEKPVNDHRRTGRTESPAADDVSRRGFLKLAGFGVGAVAATSCQRGPVEKAIPYLVQPEETISGTALYYASTCRSCPAACGMLVKTVDGRPIKLEGNPEHPLSRGGLCATGQAALLGLYDGRRLSGPLQDGQQISWDKLDSELASRLNRVRSQGGRVRFLTPTLVSPTLRATVERFLGSFDDGRLVEFDPISAAAIAAAHEQTHGARLVPQYRFDRAAVVVSFDADFLGTWLAPVEFARDYAARRQPETAPELFSYHAQVESRMSVTGANADRRIVIAPGELQPAMAGLLSRLASVAGWDPGSVPARTTEADPEALDELAARLWAARGRSLVVCGSQDVESQVLCNALNEVLANYGSSVDLESPSLRFRGDDRRLVELVRELEDGAVDALFIADSNPVYSLPQGNQLAAAIGRVATVVAFAERSDETSELAHFVCAVPDPLETWGDAEPADGIVSLAQPALQPLGDTRPLVESLAGWSGDSRAALQILQDHWREEIHPRSGSGQAFEGFWDRSLHDGFVRLEAAPSATGAFKVGAVPKAVRPADSGGSMSLVAYPKVGLRDGAHAYNPWLQELPDPVTKVTWDNYACLSPATSERLGVGEGDVVRITADEAAVELPVWVQPGQHDQVVAVALGYGSRATERFAGIGPAWISAGPTLGPGGRIGVNVAPLLSFQDGLLQLSGRTVTVEPTGESRSLASTQDYHRIEVPEHLSAGSPATRPIVRETTLEALLGGQALDHPHHAGEALWPEDHPFEGHHWGMAIDLEACTGCAACVVACQVENNVPVVGRDEVARNREMHWIRIDRYYRGGADEPDVAFQPMMCAQCDHAPCETVCPVLATVHSTEGLNQQVYNRCVGTRYCANNCPYKMRRFNWFDYSRQDPVSDLVLNPNVTVRSRGVMEKCTFCVQRIQEARLEARRSGRSMAEGDIQTACQQSCPAQAIAFGDMNDPESRVSRLMHSPRAFRVLEELDVRPSVTYLALVRNRPAGSEEEQHHG